LLTDRFKASVEVRPLLLPAAILFTFVLSIFKSELRKSSFVAMSFIDLFGNSLDAATVLMFSARRELELSLASFFCSSGRPATSMIFS
jgi:hypothetical protein